MKTLIREQVGRALITFTHDNVAGADIWRVETLTSGVYNEEHSKSWPQECDATDWFIMVKAFYNPNPDPTILYPTTPVIERPEPRPQAQATLANLTVAGWTTAQIAKYLGVTPQTVNRWRRGGTPNETNAIELKALNDILWGLGKGCACHGYGIVATGDTRNGDGRIVTAVQRCTTCNPAKKG